MKGALCKRWDMNCPYQMSANWKIHCRLEVEEVEEIEIENPITGRVLKYKQVKTCPFEGDGNVGLGYKV